MAKTAPGGCQVPAGPAHAMPQGAPSARQPHNCPLVHGGRHPGPRALQLWVAGVESSLRRQAVVPVGYWCPPWALLTPLWLHQATTSNMGMVDGGSWPSPSPIGRPAGGGAGSPPEVSRKLPRTCQPIAHPRAVQSHGTMTRLEHLLVSLCAGTDWHDCGHVWLGFAASHA